MESQATGDTILSYQTDAEQTDGEQTVSEHDAERGARFSSSRLSGECVNGSHTREDPWGTPVTP